MTDLSKTSNASAAVKAKPAVSMITIDQDCAGQRIDNFLTKTLKGVPKSHLYRILRSGEVRVNSKRIDATYRLMAGDLVRIPPVRVASPSTDMPATLGNAPRLERTVIFEDAALLVIDKPAGIAVHGGSGISRGVIEQLRLERPQAKFLELVHRLDRETSGVLMLAKKRSALVQLHEAIRDNQTDKRYLMLVHGHWQDQKRRVSLPLQKYVLASGERRRPCRGGRDRVSSGPAPGVAAGATASAGRTSDIRTPLPAWRACACRRWRRRRGSRGSARRRSRRASSHGCPRTPRGMPRSPGSRSRRPAGRASRSR